MNCEITKGFKEDTELRKRYQDEGFGLETVFEFREWAIERINLIKSWGLSETDIRLFQHISSHKSGMQSFGEIYVKDNRGLRVHFLNEKNE